MEKVAFKNKLYSGELGESACVISDSCSGKISGTGSDTDKIKKSAFYTFSSLIFAAFLFSGIINLVYLMKNDQNKNGLVVPEGYVLLPKQQISKATNTPGSAPQTTLIIPSISTASESMAATPSENKRFSHIATTTQNAPRTTISTTRSTKFTKATTLGPYRWTTLFENHTQATSTANPTEPTSSKECPAGWLVHGPSCYYFSDKSATWSDSVVLCKELGSYLVEITDGTEDLFLIEQVKRTGESFWIGLNDLEEENTWIWITSKTVVSSSSYTNWGPGQPNNCCGGEHCADIAAHRVFLWNDEPCDRQTKFICEM